MFLNNFVLFLSPRDPYKDDFLSIIQFLMVCPQFATVSYEIPIDLTQAIFRKILFWMRIVFLLINILPLRLL